MKGTFIPNLKATNAKGKILSRCVFCGRPAEWHFPEGSLCTDHAVKSGALGR
jgi:hypothetical protein